MPRKQYPPHIIVDQPDIRMPLAQSAGFRALRKPFPLEAHLHNGYEITFLTEGEVTWAVDTGEELVLSGGDMAIVQPGHTHHGKWSIIRPCRLFWFVVDPQAVNATQNTVFSADQIGAFGRQLDNAGNCVVKCAGHTRACFERLLLAFQAWHKDPGDQVVLAGLRLRICDALLACWQELQARALSTPVDPLIKQIADYLTVRLQEPIGVRDMARRAGMHPTAFSRRFKELSGQTPADFLRRLRCKRACEILRKKDSPITDLAFDLGFSSSQHFARTFKLYTGMTPSDYRKQAASS